MIQLGTEWRARSHAACRILIFLPRVHTVLIDKRLLGVLLHATASFPHAQVTATPNGVMDKEGATSFVPAHAKDKSHIPKSLSAHSHCGRIPTSISTQQLRKLPISLPPSHSRRYSLNSEDHSLLIGLNPVLSVTVQKRFQFIIAQCLASVESRARFLLLLLWSLASDWRQTVGRRVFLRGRWWFLASGRTRKAGVRRYAFQQHDP